MRILIKGYVRLLIFLTPFTLIGEEIACRDGETGAFLPCTLVVNKETYPLSSGYQILTFPSGKHPLTVKAENHKALTTTFTFPTHLKTITFWLDPWMSHPLPSPPPGMTRLTGFVYDPIKGKPLEGVKVWAEGRETLTDKEGFYDITVPAEIATDTYLPTLTLTFEKPGYEQVTLKDILQVNTAYQHILDLFPGREKRIQRDKHHFLEPEEPNPLKNQEEEGYLPLPKSLNASTPPQLLLSVVNPPDTIRVGMNCSCTNCSSVDVLSLETYVKRGLNDEWIASWHTQSLRSGSIPYRSYGTWYVYNPLNANYDICSTTCCQVNDTDTTSSTNLAVDKTAGILLERNGSIFRAEYSAENNAWDDPNDGLSCVNSDLSCGDGYAGSPANSWPCLADSPCAGKGCFGHGRGMCQWGTQRWANTYGEYWKWITNHYYNANGGGSGLRTAVMTSPCQIDSVTPNSSTVNPGDTLMIYIDATNLAESTHDQILLGASLYSASTGYIDDPSNDTKVSLLPGANSVSRPFTVPTTTPDGSYDLIVALWLDVDEDNTISGTDLALTSTTLPSAIEVTSVVTGTCANPYLVSSFPYTHNNTNSGTQSLLSGYNCQSLRPTGGYEVVYQVTLSEQGTLTASLGNADPLDLFLLSACDAYQCIAYGDQSLQKDNLSLGTYYLVVDGGSSASYSLTIDFTPRDWTPPGSITDLKLTKNAGQIELSWSAPTVDIYGNPETPSRYHIWKGTTPTTLTHTSETTGTSLLMDDLTPGATLYYRVSGEDSWGNRRGACDGEVILDNPQASFSGSWTEGTAQPDKYQSSYHYAWGSGSDQNMSTYIPFISCSGLWEVQTWYPATTNRCTTTRYTIYHEGGSTPLSVDQTGNGGHWYSLGVFTINAGKGNPVIISDDNCNSSQVTVADGMRWVASYPREFILDDDEATFVGDWVYSSSSYGYNGDYYWRSTGGTGSNYTQWVPFLYRRGVYDVYVWYRSGSNRTTQAPYTITTASGDMTVTVNQQINGSQWVYIGSWELNPATAKITVSDNAPAGYVVVADAVRFVLP